MAHPFTIRPLRSSDATALASWLSESEPWRTLGYPTEAWPGYFQALTADSRREADVIVLDEVPEAGLAVVRRQVLLGDYLELFAIAPAARRRGLGHALLAHVEARAFIRTTNFYLCVSDFNADGRAFYESAGYREVGRLENLVVPGHAELLMRKTIGPARRG
jgi:ribosomal protein S18 acetylase RimI-like enzyme